MSELTRRILTIPSATAGWGVVTGFALAAKLWLESMSGRPLPSIVLKLAVGLVMAVVVAAFLDWIKERLDPDSRPERRFSTSRLVTSIVVLAAFEFVAVAIDSVQEVWWEREHELVSLAATVTSPEEPWAFLWPEDVHDVRTLRSALTGPQRRSVQRVHTLLSEETRALLRREDERDKEITRRSGAILERRLQWGSLSAAILSDNRPLELPPLRTAAEVTATRRELTAALNVLLMRRDLFADRALWATKEIDFARGTLLQADPSLPLRSLVRLNRKVLERELPARVVAAMPDTAFPAIWHLGGMIGLWTLAGAVVGFGLAVAVAGSDESTSSRFGWGVIAGGLAGGLAAPALIPLYLVGTRLAGIGWLMWTRPEQAERLVAAYRLDHLPGPLALFSVLFTSGRWGVVLLVVGIAAAVAAAVGRDSWLPLAALGLVVAILCWPLLEWTLLTLAVHMAKVWLVPAVTLGALIPALRRGRSEPRLWGTISLVAAAVLGTLTALRLRHEADVLVWLGGLVAAGLLIAGILLHRRHLSWEAWPVVAIALGIITGGEILTLHATFRDVFAEMRAMTERVSPRAEAERIDARPLSGDALFALVRSRYASPLTFASDPAPLPEPGPRRPDEIFLPDAAQHEVRATLDVEAERLGDFSRLLEVTLVASFGFWATTGLLAAWALRAPPDEAAA